MDTTSLAEILIHRPVLFLLLSHLNTLETIRFFITNPAALARIANTSYKTELLQRKQQLIEDFDAVKQDGFALKYVKEQTPEICLDAVKQDGTVLEFVKVQTPEICEAVVKQNARASIYVKI
jgi:Domain of unknown function (DUF4116)